MSVERGTAASSAETRIARLRRAYAAILEGYREIERLARRVRRTLRGTDDVAAVREILRRKRAILQEIRIQEERVSGERDWWKRSRRSLPSASCRDLLSLLDAISRAVDGAVSLEAECRGLLEAPRRPGATSSSRPEPGRWPVPEQVPEPPDAGAARPVSASRFPATS